MQSVRFEDPVCSSSGEQFSTHQVGQPCNDHSHAERDLQAHSGQNSYPGSLQGRPGQNRILETIKTAPMPSKPPSFIDTNKSPRSTSPSPSTWDLVTPPASPEKTIVGEMDQLLTAEEKAQIMSALRARRAAREPVPESHDLAQAFEAELSQ